MHDDPDDVGYEWKRWRKKTEIRKQPLNCIKKKNKEKDATISLKEWIMEWNMDRWKTYRTMHVKVDIPWSCV